MIVRPLPRSDLWWARSVPAALLLLAAGILFTILGRIVLVPLIVSFAIAFMLEPLTDRLERNGHSRTQAVLLSLIVAALGMLLILLFLLPSVIRQLGQSFERFPLALSAIAEQSRRNVLWAQIHLSQEMFERLSSALHEVQTNPSTVTSEVAGWLTVGALGLLKVGSSAVGLVVVPFFVFYLSLDMHHLRTLFESHLPEQHRPEGRRLLDEITVVTRGYVQGRFLMALIMAGIYSAGLLLLGVPLWAAIGLIAGIIGIVPYLGVLSGLILALGFAALDGASFWRLAGIGGVFGVAQVIEDYVLTPRLIGNKLELHPMLVLLALMVGGDLFGLLGLVLAIPVLAILKVIVRFFDGLYFRSSYFRGAGSPGRRDSEQVPEF